MIKFLISILTVILFFLSCYKVREDSCEKYLSGEYCVISSNVNLSNNYTFIFSIKDKATGEIIKQEALSTKMGSSYCSNIPVDATKKQRIIQLEYYIKEVSSSLRSKLDTIHLCITTTRMLF